MTCRQFFVRTLPIALILMVCLVGGFQSGERVAGYVAYIHRDYPTALQHYSMIGDHSGSGMTFLAMGMTDNAMQEFQQNSDWKGIGLTYCKKRDHARALACFEKAKDESGKGLAYLGLRDEAHARESFTKANDWSGLGLLALAKQDYALAQDCFSKADDSSGLALVALKQKKFNDAYAWFQKEKDTSGLGLVLLGCRNPQGAIPVFQSINDQSGIGYCQMQTGNVRAAFTAFLQANDLNGLGDLYSHLHQFAKAREAFEKDHNPVKVIQSYRNDYTLKDRREHALAYGRAAIARGDHAPECLMEMGDIYYDLGQTQQGLAALDQAAAYPGYASQAHLFKGRIYFYQRDFARAQAEFAQVQPDDLNGDERYLEAQSALKVLAAYQGLNVQAAPSF